MRPVASDTSDSPARKGFFDKSGKLSERLKKLKDTDDQRAALTVARATGESTKNPTFVLPGIN